jgi:hypothetical protein
MGVGAVGGSATSPGHDFGGSANRAGSSASKSSGRSGSSDRTSEMNSMAGARADDRASVKGYSGDNRSRSDRSGKASRSGTRSAESMNSMADARAADRASVRGYSGDGKSRTSNAGSRSQESMNAMAEARAADRRSVPGYSADSTASRSKVADAYGEYARSRLEAGTAVQGRLNGATTPSYRQAEIASMATFERQKPDIAAMTPLGSYSPTRPGWHDYVTTNQVSTPDMNVTREEIADQLSRYAVPGQAPTKPVENGKIYSVYDPFTNQVPGGKIRTKIERQGLRITNTTRPGHVFHDGMISRTAWQAADGSWHVTTRGIGNNEELGMDKLNQWSGPDIFDQVDRQMRENMERHHGKSRIAGR